MWYSGVPPTLLCAVVVSKRPLYKSAARDGSVSLRDAFPAPNLPLRDRLGRRLTKARTAAAAAWQNLQPKLQMTATVCTHGVPFLCTLRRRRSAGGLCSATAIALLAGVAAPLFAQSVGSSSIGTSSPNRDDDDAIVKLSSFVVVGSVIDKTELETANSVATVDRTQMDRLSPRSTADLLTQIPGIYVEPTAGQISNNYYIRGLPSGGGTKFLGLVEDGLPIVINNSDFTFRGDALTTDRVEVLRGGASSILTSYAVGGTVNFINREGDSTAEGGARLTFSDYGQIRGDLFYAGPLGARATYSVGGYYNSSESQRDTGWGKMERGGQLVGNIRFNFPDDRGYFKISARHLDDQSAYFATELYQNQTDPESIPGGPDIRDGTYYGPALSRMTIWTGQGPIVNDFTDGVPVRMTYGGTELRYDFADGWTLFNRNRATRYHHEFNGLFGGNTVDSTGNALATYGIPILIQAASQKLGFSSLAAFASYRLTDAVTGELIDPPTMNGNGAIQLIYPMLEFGLEKNYQNDLQLRKAHGDSVTTLGFYYSWYDRDFTQFGNQALTDVRNHARLLDVEAFDAAGNSLGFITDRGFTQYGSWYTRNTYKQENIAPYLTTEVKLGRWRFDAGWRHEEVDQTFHQGPQTNYTGFIARDVDQHNPALYGGNTVAPGAWTRTETSSDTDCLSGGVNFLLSDNSAIYGRYSVGDFLSQDPQSTTPTPQPRITQIELGYRGQWKSLVWSATLFDSEATNNSVNVGIPVNGTLIFDNKYLKTRNYGVELLATWRATRDLAFDLQGTFSESGYEGEGFVQAPNGTNIPIDGKRPVRQPNEIFSITARYGFELFGWRRSEIFVNNAYTGKRASDIANTVWLPEYNVVNAGLIIRPRENLSVRVQVANLFDEIGLTEGNPRQTQVVGTANAVYYGARAIFGRSVQAAIEYRF
jgi:iron complex outermembrane recepter protein